MNADVFWTREPSKQLGVRGQNMNLVGFRAVREMRKKVDDVLAGSACRGREDVDGHSHAGRDSPVADAMVAQRDPPGARSVAHPGATGKPYESGARPGNSPLSIKRRRTSTSATSVKKKGSDHCHTSPAMPCTVMATIQSTRDSPSAWPYGSG